MQDENQPQQKSQQIITLLKQSSDQGLKFEEAKEKLRSQGFSDTDINEATDDYQYGEKQVSDIPPQVTQYFNQHPDEALKDGANLLSAVKKEERTEDRIQAVIDYGAERSAAELGPGATDVRVEFASRFSNDVGISFWGFVGIGILVNGIAIAIVLLLHLKGWFYIINGVLSLGAVIYLIWRID